MYAPPAGKNPHRWKSRRAGERALRYLEATNLVLLEPDVRKAFRNERAVNDALRLVIALPKVGSYKRRDYSSNGDTVATRRPARHARKEVAQGSLSSLAALPPRRGFGGA